MVNYKISFNFNLEDLSTDNSEDKIDIEILEIDDSCFDDIINDSTKIKEFENIYNENLDDENKVSILNVTYDKFEEEVGILKVTTKSELKEPKMFAEELVNYMFEEECPTVYYNISGTVTEPYWDYTKSSSDERNKNIDYEDSISIDKFFNVTINEE